MASGFAAPAGTRALDALLEALNPVTPSGRPVFPGGRGLDALVEELSAIAGVNQLVLDPRRRDTVESLARLRRGSFASMLGSEGRARLFALLLQAVIQGEVPAVVSPTKDAEEERRNVALVNQLDLSTRAGVQELMRQVGPFRLAPFTVEVIQQIIRDAAASRGVNVPAPRAPVPPPPPPVARPRPAEPTPRPSPRIEPAPIAPVAGPGPDPVIPFSTPEGGPMAVLPSGATSVPFTGRAPSGAANDIAGTVQMNAGGPMMGGAQFIQDPSAGFLSGLGKAVVGGVGGFLTGGPVGAIAGVAGGIADEIGGSRTPSGNQAGAGSLGPGGLSSLGLVPGGAGAQQCPPGTRPTRILGGLVERCSPTATAAPTSSSSGTRQQASASVTGSSVRSAGDVMSAEPDIVQPAPKRRCPRGMFGERMVLGKDGKCYLRSVIPNRHRMYPRPSKPPITREDIKCVTKADRVKRKLVKLTRKAGGSAKLS